MVNAIENQRNITLLSAYFDIMGTTSLGEFAEVFSKALLRSISKTENAFRGFMKKLAAVRPGLSNEKEAGLSLDLIFSIITKEKRSFVIAIDEFQQITSYPEKNIEAALRSRIQQINNMNVIFSGSKKHMLSDIFSQASRPFFNSTETMFLDTIPFTYSPYVIVCSVLSKTSRLKKSIKCFT